MKTAVAQIAVRDLMQFDSVFRHEIEENLELLTPPGAIEHLGYLVANDLRLPDDRAIPIFLCMTPIGNGVKP